MKMQRILNKGLVRGENNSYFALQYRELYREIGRLMRGLV
jgi:hypothetical protein